MDDKRNRILELVNYLQSLGIVVNIGKNKARGNKGFFRAKEGEFRIDIARNQSDDEVLRLLVHEFAHYLHYSYDKNLKSLNFVFKGNEDTLLEEMISLTVDLIPKSSVEPLFKAKEELKDEMKYTTGIDLELRKRALRKINSKIARLNRYYNMPTELFARSMEMYFTARDKCKRIAPNICEQLDSVMKNGEVPELNALADLV